MADWTCGNCGWSGAGAIRSSLDNPRFHCPECRHSLGTRRDRDASPALRPASDHDAPRDRSPGVAPSQSNPGLGGGV